jgi:hypothetical protein
MKTEKLVKTEEATKIILHKASSLKKVDERMRAKLFLR